MAVVESSTTRLARSDGEPSLYAHAKPVLDCALAVLLAVFCLPLLAVIAVVIRLTSRGPAVYRQRRVGCDGRMFTLYKLRTMVHDAEARTGPVWAQPDDPRVTRLGAFLRRTHLDELPQIVNVLKGEMSLVGPRPERPEFVQLLAREIPDYLERLTVRPGITGLAQLYLPPDAHVDDVRKKLALDLQYLRQMGPALDLKILACTGVRLARIPHGWAHRFTRLDRHLRRPMAARPVLSHSPEVQD